MSEVTAVPLRPIKKGSLVVLWIGIGLAAAAAVGLAWTSTAGQVALSQPPEAFMAANAHQSGVVTLPSGLQYRVITPGHGPKATARDTGMINYDGMLVDGHSFDASAKHGGPVPFPVAPGNSIPGFSEGLQQMNTGAKYRFWIPPTLGYGVNPVPDQSGKIVIPGNSVLVFDVELLGILPPQAMGGMGGPGAMGGAGGPHGDTMDPAQMPGGMH